MCKFSASILGRETPVYDGGSVVALTFECVDLPSQRHFIADTTVETLVAEDTQFYLDHVQPTAVYWSVVEFQALGDAPRVGWLEGIVQRTQLVSVEIVSTSRIVLASG